MSELLLNTIIEKLSMQSIDIDAIREKIENSPVNLDVLKDLRDQLTSIEKIIQKISFPEKEVKQLSFDLNRATSMLQQPQKNEVVHHHHIPKLIWITASLFVIICLICSCWYSTHDKLQSYIAGDTKYRYLKLDSDRTLQRLLFFTDSFYNINPKMRADVITIEEENKERLELQQQADEKQKEADALRIKAEQKRK